jgi:CheY-like chemotaxis protein
MKRILFVEDDEMSRDVISTRLTRSGYDIAVVEDGNQALAAVETHAFDLIILDMSMPGMSGWDTARRSRPPSPFSRSRPTP